MVFETLDSRLRALIKERGWEKPTIAQEKAVPEILNGKNVLLISPTGLGKTEAAMLPIFNIMLKEKVEPVAVLYITPLRALINDIVKRLEWWASRLGFIVARKHGEVSASEKAKRLRNVPHIMVITPESLEIDLDWASKFRENYRNVRWVIVDEVHELVQSKRGIQLAVLLERLHELTGNDFQRIGLSATLGNPEEAAKLLFGSSKRPGCIVKAVFDKEVKISIHSIPEDIKDPWLEAAKKICEVIEPPSLIFVNSRFTAEALHEALEKLALKKIYVHHSSVSRHIKSNVEELLRKGALTAVVCTKTLELGIDIGDINKVIQFRSPGAAITLIQRIGRSGHKVYARSQGSIVSVGTIDAWESLALAIKARKGILERTKFLMEPLDVLAKEIVGMCLQYGPLEPKFIYDIVKRSYPYHRLSYSKFLFIIQYLLENNILAKTDSNRFKVGGGFYKIWRFDINHSDKKWWARSFTEFFSTMSERDSFIVRYGNRIIGDIDSVYVFRYLRVGDVIRLSGRNWRVIDIDENHMKLEVVPTGGEEEGEIPIWRGEGSRRDKDTAKIMVDIIRNLQHYLTNEVKGDIEIDGITERLLSNLVKTYEENNIPLPSENRLIVERHGEETYFIAPLGQNVAETLAHIIMYLISARYTLNVTVKTSHLGFMVKVKNVDPLRMLLSLDINEVSKILYEAVKRSPFLQETIKNIKLSFGKIGKIDPEEDTLIIGEAVKQVKQLYLDFDETLKYIEKLKNKEIEVIEVSLPKYSPIAEYISKLPPERPWISDATILIIKTLEKVALTVDELSEILELPKKTIENKLKELRKPGNMDRVFQFIDVDLNEWRWALVKDAEEIFKSEEYSYCFIPDDVNETFLLQMKPLHGKSFYSVYFSPREILESIETFKQRLPVKETHEVRVVALSDELLKSLSPKYYYLPAEVIPYIALNGAVHLQKLKQTT